VFAVTISIAQAGSLSGDIEQFSKDNPQGFSAVCRNIASYYHKKGNLTRALDWTERILAIQPQNYQVQFYKAQLLFSLKRHSQCEKLLKKLEGKSQLKNSPLLVSVRNLLYKTYKQAKKLPREQKQIEKKLKARKVDLDTYRQAFMMFRVSENYKKTIKYAKKAIKAYPQESSFRFALAYAYEQKNKIKAARREYKALIKKHPDNLNAYNLLLNMLKEKKRLKEARALWEDFVQKDKQNLYKQWQLVDILYTMGQLDAATVQLDLIQKTHPNNPQVLRQVKRYRQSIQTQRKKQPQKK